MSFITSIGTSNPSNKFSQKQIADFMIKAMALSPAEASQLRILYRASGIETRHSVLKDYGTTGQFSFYANSDNLEPFPGTRQRLDFYKNESIQLSKQAAEKCIGKVSSFNRKDITHLIVVSCTGMFAPGLDIMLIQELGLSTTIQRTSINFMGCYAAFNALRVADALCEQTNGRVLVICTELCSLHFQKEKNQDNILANALFADGSAAVLVESSPRGSVNLSLGNFFCDLAPESQQDMAWTIGDQGFEMRLSSYVPAAIRSGIKKLTNSLLSVNKISPDDIDFYAIHPGGKKILEAIEDELVLTKADNRFAYTVMKNYGNMSSPTVLFVLHEIFKSLTVEDNGKKILSFGFGPGLTLESLILTVEAR